VLQGENPSGASLKIKKIADQEAGEAAKGETAANAENALHGRRKIARGYPVFVVFRSEKHRACSSLTRSRAMSDCGTVWKE